MKPRFSVAMALLLSLFIVCSGVAYAEELWPTTRGSLNALNSGWAIARWPWDGGNILVGETATVRACTTHPPPETVMVAFRWNSPDGSHDTHGPYPLADSGDTWKGDPVWDAYDSMELNVLGGWGVQALFCDSEGKELPISPCPTVDIKAISWHVVPEVPFGTIATILGMFGAFGAFALRARKK